MDVKKEVFIEAMVRTYGNISASAQLAGIARQTYYDWINNDPEFATAMKNGAFEERMKDYIELKLIEQAKKNNTAVLIFMAKTKMKDRGYVERSELSGPGGIPLPSPSTQKVQIKLSNGTEIDLD